MRVPLSEARPGDVLIFKRDGLISSVLSWLIQKIKEPNWDRWGWHMCPVVDYNGNYMDAQFPKLNLSNIKDIKGKVRCYRVLYSPPPKYLIDAFLNNTLNTPYDIFIYLWTALWALNVPIPRIINRSYSCWETTFAALECWGYDIDWTDLNYPFITDFLKAEGELS